MDGKYIDGAGEPEGELGGRRNNETTKVRLVSSYPLSGEPDTHGL